VNAAAPRVATQRRAAGPAHLRVVRTRGRRAPRVRFALLAGCLVVVLVLGVVTLQAMVSQDSFRIERLSARTEQLRQQAQELRLQVARLSAPDRIAREASHLGLVLPSEVHAIEIPPSSPSPGAP
jgi:cell division protein FtsL